jgi:Tfp pilus assembly protein PilE
MIYHDRQRGFTTVELLITLFVAAAFLATGFMLYTAIVRNGADSRQMTQVNDVAYAKLRALASTTPACSTTPTVVSSTPSISGVSNPTLTTTISAPYGCPWDNSIMKAQVTITYGPDSNRQEVDHAIYVKR